MYYAPSIFESLGFRRAKLLAQGVNGVVNFLATFIAFFFVDRLGRRTLFLAGALGMGVSMMTLGLLGEFYGYTNGGMSSPAAGYAAIMSIFFFVASFACSWGPGIYFRIVLNKRRMLFHFAVHIITTAVAWIYPTEIFPTAQRARGVALTTSTNFLFNGLIAIFVPKLQETTGSMLYIGFGACCGAIFCVTLFLLPETKGRSLESMVSVTERRLHTVQNRFH
jgi:MFS family permease